MSGMVGALLVTVLFVVAFVAFRALTRDEVAVEREPIDYLPVVERAAQSGDEVVHPPDLPEGWIATSVDYTGGDRPVWGLGILTDEGAFAGLRQEDTNVDDLVETYVDEDAVQGEPVDIDGALGGTWQSWSDEGGDHAYSTTVGDETVLVYGSAPAAELRDLAGRLTR